jgi:IS30 family transposase
MQAIVGVIEDYKHQKSIRSIPLKLFSNRKLGVLEVIVKYLKENQNLPYNEIASLLNRDDRTIWTSYNKAIKKHKDKFSQNNTDTIDISIFHDRKQAPLQALVNHLKEKGMSYKKIAEALNRSYKTIWITNKRK